MFLPKEASLLVYFLEEEKDSRGIVYTLPRLDWDLLNNLSYLRVHWLPRRETANDYEAFIRLIDLELSTISQSSVSA